MADGVLLIGEDLAYLSSLSNELKSVDRNVTIVTLRHPVRAALRHGIGPASVAIVALDGSENIGDVQELIHRSPSTTFLLLTRQLPPRSSLTHAVHRAGGEISSLREPPIVIAAMVVALLAQAKLSTEKA